MSREIIQLQVGQAGNNIGTKFWEVISDEHGIDKSGNYHGNSPVSQLERIDVYFAQGSAAEKYKPRAVLVDLDFVSLESIRSEPLGKFYNQDNFVSGYGGTEHNYAKGHYTDGAAIVDEAMDVLRKEAENCSSLQGFQMTHSLAGGTGSGLGTLLLSKIVDAYPDRMISTYSVVPSPKTLMEAWDPYNVVMACNSLITQSHATFCIDNEALYDICLDTQGVSSPTFDDLNHLVSATMSGVTAAFRYPGHVNETLMKMAVNMAPFPQLHFLLSGYAPLTKRGSPPKTNLTVPEVAQHLFDAKSMLAACDPSHGRSLTTAAHFRGSMTLKEVDEQMQQVRDKNSNYFVDWIPDNVLTSVCKTPPQGLNMSGTYIANSTAIKKVFQRISTQFAQLYKRKAFLNKYSSEGLYEMEIQEADYNVRNLIKEYQQYEDATAD